MSERAHTVEEIREHWLKNRGADGSDWEQALGAVYDLGRASCAPIRVAAEQLVRKIYVVQEATRGVYTMAAVHGALYSGPTYAAEITELERVLGMEKTPR